MAETPTENKPEEVASKPTPETTGEAGKTPAPHGYGHGHKTDWSGWEMLVLAGVFFLTTVGLIALMLALAPSGA